MKRKLLFLILLLFPILVLAEEKLTIKDTQLVNGLSQFKDIYFTDNGFIITKSEFFVKYNQDTKEIKQINREGTGYLFYVTNDIISEIPHHNSKIIEVKVSSSPTQILLTEYDTNLNVLHESSFECTEFYPSDIQMITSKGKIILVASYPYGTPQYKTYFLDSNYELITSRYDTGYTITISPDKKRLDSSSGYTFTYDENNNLVTERDTYYKIVNTSLNKYYNNSITKSISLDSTKEYSTINYGNRVYLIEDNKKVYIYDNELNLLNTEPNLEFDRVNIYFELEQLYIEYLIDGDYPQYWFTYQLDENGNKSLVDGNELNNKYPSEDMEGNFRYLNIEDPLIGAKILNHYIELNISKIYNIITINDKYYVPYVKINTDDRIVKVLLDTFDKQGNLLSTKGLGTFNSCNIGYINALALNNNILLSYNAGQRSAGTNTVGIKLYNTKTDKLTDFTSYLPSGTRNILLYNNNNRITAFYSSEIIKFSGTNTAGDIIAGETSGKIYYYQFAISYEQKLIDNNITLTNPNPLPGEEVEIKVEEKEGYAYKIVVKDEEGNEIPTTNNKYIAPDSNVTIDIKYTKIEKDIIDVINPFTKDGLLLSIFILATSITIIRLLKEKKKLLN